jgi:hypothetical protein
MRFGRSEAPVPPVWSIHDWRAGIYADKEDDAILIAAGEPGLTLVRKRSGFPNHHPREEGRLRMATKSGRSTPNLFELQGAGVQVSYSTTSITGAPLFHYQDASHDASFSGEQITVAKSNLGRLVTVTIDTVPDRHVLSFTLVLPDVTLPDTGEARIRTFGVLTTVKTTIGGPAFLRGQVQSYRVKQLNGAAKRVSF